MSHYPHLWSKVRTYACGLLQRDNVMAVQVWYNQFSDEVQSIISQVDGLYACACIGRGFERLDRPAEGYHHQFIIAFVILNVFALELFFDRHLLLLASLLLLELDCALLQA